MPAEPTTQSSNAPTEPKPKTDQGSHPQKSPAQVSDADAASQLLDKLRQLQTSPFILYLLKLRPGTLQRTETGSLLYSLFQQHGLRWPMGRDFFRRVSNHANEIRPIAPDFYTVDFKRDKAVDAFRAELIARRERNKGEPFMHLGAFMPFCFQCLKSQSAGKAFGKSLFFCFATPEDGVIMIHKILSAGGYQLGNIFYHLSQVYEHRIDATMLASPRSVDNRLTYIMLDWEVYEGRVQGRLSHDELRDLCLSFPDWFCGEMYRLGFVDSDAFLTGEICPIRTRCVHAHCTGADTPRPQPFSSRRAGRPQATTSTSTRSISSSSALGCRPRTSPQSAPRSSGRTPRTWPVARRTRTSRRSTTPRSARRG